MELVEGRPQDISGRMEKEIRVYGKAHIVQPVLHR